MTKSLIALISLLLFVQCDKNDGKVITGCGQEVLINSSLFDQADSQDLSVLEISIEGDCLKVTVQATGCDGSNWIISLIDSGDIAESLPPQRSLRFSFENTAECDALPTKEYEFDISGLRVDSPSVKLTFREFDKSILYEY